MSDISAAELHALVGDLLESEPGLRPTFTGIRTSELVFDGVGWTCQRVGGWFKAQFHVPDSFAAQIIETHFVRWLHEALSHPKSMGVTSIVNVTEMRGRDEGFTIIASGGMLPTGSKPVEGRGPTRLHAVVAAVRAVREGKA